MNLIKKAVQAIRLSRAMQRISLALARAGTISQLRKVAPNIPISWEFSGFSQNGEDGIVDFLCSQLKSSNRYFVEIGAADGLENNTAWLAIAKKYSGLMIEGDETLSKRQKNIIPSLNLGVECLNCFVTKENVDFVIEKMLYRNPDVFSIDIDGNDYHILKLFLDKKVRPKIIIVEYNSAFGPNEAITIPYQSDFNYALAHPSALYYGVSVQAWIRLMTSFGYRFVTVDSNGVNAFFVAPEYFSAEWLESLCPLEFAENFYQFHKFRQAWDKQFENIKDMNFEVICE